jgi:2-hydroxychromene-2-carboxylate isomerase
MELEFFYDFVSPYSYLASTRVEALAARHATGVRFRPFLLGGVFKATGNRAPIEVAAKGAHMWVDLARWARRLEVPFVRPAVFPCASILALRAAFAADAAGALVPYTHAVFRAYWAEGKDLGEPAVVVAAANRAGLDGAALVAAAPAHKAALLAQTQEAVDRGSFGAPTFFFGQELFVGNDRLELVEEALRAARAAP